MSNKSTIWTRSLLIGLALGLAAYGVYSMFFRMHGELGVEPASAKWLGLLVFLVAALSSLIYFGIKASR